MVELVIAALGALVVGLVIGWLVASRRGVAELAAAKVHADQHDMTRQQLLAVTAERGLLAAVEGSCKIPIAGHAQLVDGVITLKGLIANLAGTSVVTGEISGDPGKARELGITLGKEILDRGGREILAEISQHGTGR